ncbi:MAG: ABC transporter ATP-binding protein [Ignavibacteriales bacterium]|nr:ABC transporter ATP-binding protein [Ignavibacteriales bacterium]
MVNDPSVNSTSVFLRLLSYLLRYKWRVMGGLISVAIMSLADAGSAFLVAKLFDVLHSISQQVQRGMEIAVTVPVQIFGRLLASFEIHGKEESFAMIFWFAVVTVGIILVKILFVYVREYLMSSVREKFLMRFRIDLFDTIVVLPVRYFDVNKTGQIMSRVTNDVNNLEQSVILMTEIAQNIVYTIIFATALFFTNWQLTVFTIALFMVSGLISRRFGDRIRSYSRELTKTLADISAFLQEKISSIRIVKSFGREEFEKASFKRRAESNYHYSMRIARAVAFLSPTNELFNTTAGSLLVVFTGFLFIQGSMTIESMIYFLIVMINLSKPVKGLGESFARIQKTFVSAGFIFEVLDAETEQLTQTPSLNKVTRGKVEFRAVSFSYNEQQPILQDVNVNVESGHSVALVGPSGSGKTTFVNLIPRFYECTTGCIMIDGIDIREIGLSDLRRAIAIVPQDVQLFAGTVLENIRYGRLDATKEEIVNAAIAANAHEFVERMTHGYETEIGERGIQLSGGQRQRIAIARAILRNPHILLLDEATSALDTESERLVQDAINKLMKGRTSFVIAHRLSTVTNCDRIIVLERGRIVESGTHESLLAKPNGTYTRLYEMQFKEPSTPS